MILLSGILIGLLGSLHCMSMCGPLVMAINYHQKSFGKNLIYHTGRLLCYLLLGAMIGSLGQGLLLAGMQQGLSILAGMIVIILSLAPHFKVGERWQSIVVRPMKKRLLGAVKGNRSSTLFTLGFLNGLLPCGMVYMAIAAALATGNMIDGAVLMAGFGLGTWPVLLVFAMGSHFIARKIKPKMGFLIPIVTCLVGGLLILRGLALEIPYISPVISALGLDAGMTICQ